MSTRPQRFDLMGQGPWSFEAEHRDPVAAPPALAYEVYDDSFQSARVQR